MEDLSRPVETLTIAVTIPMPARRADHCVDGRAVLPAVEALQILAATLPDAAGATPLVQEGALFSHLLTLDPADGPLAALHEWQRMADGRCLSRLMTVRAARQAAVTRRIEHARVWFGPAAGDEGSRCEDDPSGLRFGLSAKEEERREEDASGGAKTGPAGRPGSGTSAGKGTVGDLAASAFMVASRRLYEELVPFGPAYRNVIGDVLLTPAGARARLSGGSDPGADGPLGSPFPLDAAFHVACAWAQRYRGLVAFPVGFGRREIFRPTKGGEHYGCTVVPWAEERAGVLRFAIGIEDGEGRPVETIWDVAMRDITGGRQSPPAWVREGV